MSGYAQHGIEHVSASSLNLWAAEPALWVMERLLRLRSPVGPAAHVFYASERPDLDPSLILDALQGRVYANDRAVREMHLFHHIDRENPRAELTLCEIEDDDTDD